MLLKNEWVNNAIKDKIKKFLETNENEYTTAQNLRDTVKAVLREKFIEIQSYLKKIETFQKQQTKSTSTRTGGTTANKAQSQ